MTLSERIAAIQARERPCYRHNHEGDAVRLHCAEHPSGTVLPLPQASPFVQRAREGRLPAKSLTS